jgi:hypothetical protein
MIEDISDSRPWNIFGSGGSSVKELVLDNMRTSLCGETDPHTFAVNWKTHFGSMRT